MSALLTDVVTVAGDTLLGFMMDLFLPSWKIKPTVIFMCIYLPLKVRVGVISDKEHLMLGKCNIHSDICIGQWVVTPVPFLLTTKAQKKKKHRIAHGSNLLR